MQLEDVFNDTDFRGGRIQTGESDPNEQQKERKMRNQPNYYY
jgi:hypothetical protein